MTHSSSEFHAVTANKGVCHLSFSLGMEVFSQVFWMPWGFPGHFCQWGSLHCLMLWTTFLECPANVLRCYLLCEWMLPSFPEVPFSCLEILCLGKVKVKADLFSFIKFMLEFRMQYWKYECCKRKITNANYLTIRLNQNSPSWLQVVACNLLEAGVPLAEGLFPNKVTLSRL